MKTKQLLQYIILLIGLFGFSRCKSHRTVSDKALPFKVVSVNYFDWTGGQPGVFGTAIHIIVDGVAEVKPTYLFFKGQQLKLDVKPSGKGQVWIAILSESSAKPDRKMCLDVQDEYGNKPPVKEDFPFSLADDEAILSYIYQGEEHFYKLTEITKSKTVSYL